MNTLDALYDAGALADVDVHVAQALSRLTNDPSPEVMLAAALTVRATRTGHVCLDMGRLYDVGITDAADNRVDLVLPPQAEWWAAIGASPMVRTAAQDTTTPLVCDDDRLYLDRYWRYEQRCARLLRQRAATVPLSVGQDIIDRVVAVSSDDAAQQRAVATALTRQLTVLTGGPGTGKTTTIVHILAALLTVEPEVAGRIVLAAPTGKAAARMADAIRQHAQADDAHLADVTRAALMDVTAVTLHRLLGFNPANPTRFRHHAQRPIDRDVVVVDEASMVSLPMMAKLLDALPARARLVLVGDREQLASIDAGAVLADISTPPAARDATPEPADASGGPPHVIELHHNYRFAATSDVGALADALRSGVDADAIATIVESGRPDATAHRVDPDVTAPAMLPADIAARAIAHYTQLAMLARDAADPAGLLEHLDAFRVLAALRRGPGGVEQLNALFAAGVAAALPGETTNSAQEGAAGAWPIGTPVMVTQNDYALELFNGDVGVVVCDPVDGRRRAVVFATVSGDMRHVPLVRLSQLEPVYAMSVHKSQGSQFDTVVVALGVTDSPLLTRELVYTGITRARRAVTVVAPATILSAALARRVQRASGLRSLVWA